MRRWLRNPSPAGLWTLTTAGAFALTIAAHEVAHAAVGIVARFATEDGRPMTALAGPVASVLIVGAAVLWLAHRVRSSRGTRWAVTLGLTAAVRVFLVWLVAGPWLLGIAPRMTFDERHAAPLLGISVVALLVIETILALIGAALLIRRIPSEERRAALLPVTTAMAVIGIVALVVNPRV